MTLRNFRWWGLLVAALCGGVAFGDSLDVDFNQDAFRGAYTLSREAQGIEFDFGWLHSSDDGDVGFAGFHVLGLTGPSTRPIQAGVGGKVFVADDVDSGVAVGLGGYVRYRFQKLERLELGGALYYAPDVLSFSDATKYFEVSVQASYLVHERAAVLLGLRSVTAEFENGMKSHVDDGIHVGVRLNF